MGFIREFMDKVQGHEKNLTYPDIFHVRNWGKATIHERLSALQQLENAYAVEQGRTPCPVRAQRYDTIEIIGYFDFTDKSIAINQEYLQNQQLHKSISKEAAQYMAVETLIHEGRHAYQEFAIKNPHIHSNQDEVQKWKENAVVYYGPDDLAKYRFQPLEKDANEYAYREVDKLYRRLEEKYGKNRGYEDFIKAKNQSDEFFTKIAQKTLGDHFELEISNMIRREYQAIVGRDLDKSHFVNMKGRERLLMEGYANHETGGNIDKKEREQMQKKDDNGLIDFQKPGGPFTVKQSYEFDEVGRELDVHKVYKNDKLHKTFEKSAVSEWGAHLVAMDYIKNELFEKHPAFLDKERYYSSDLLFEKKIPVSDFKQTIEAQIKDINRDIYISQKEFQRNGFDFLEDKKLSQEEAHNLITIKVLKDIHNKFAPPDYDVQKETYQKDKAIFDAQEQPGILNVIKRAEYNKEKDRLSQEEIKIQKMDDKITDQIAMQSNKIERFFDLYLDHNFKKMTLTKLEGLHSKISAVNDQGQNISFTGNYRDLDNILDKSKSMDQQINQIIDKKHTKDNITIDFQKPGGPFEIKESWKPHYDARVEKHIMDVYEKGKHVEHFSTPGGGEWGSLPGAMKYVANNLKEKYPEYLDQEKLLENKIPFNKEIPVGKLVDTMEKRSGLLKNYIKKDAEILEQNGFRDLIKQPTNDYQKVTQMVTERYFSEDYAKLNTMNNEYNMQKHAFEKDKAAFAAQEKPDLINIFKRFEYYQEENRLKQEANKMDLLEQSIVGQEKMISGKTELHRGEIDSLSKTVYNAERDLLNSKSELKMVDGLAEKVKQISGQDQKIVFAGSYKDMQNILDQSESILDQAKLKVNHSKEHQLPDAKKSSPEMQWDKYEGLTLDRAAEIENAPAVKDLSQKPHYRTMFNAYAKEVLAENGHAWSEKNNQVIAERMLVNGSSPNVVKTAMKYSPEQIRDVNHFVKEIQNKPEVKEILLEKSKELAKSFSR